MFVAQSLLTVLLGLSCFCRARLGVYPDPVGEAGRSWVPLAFVVADLQVGSILGSRFLLEASQRALFAS